MIRLPCRHEATTTIHPPGQSRRTRRLRTRQDHLVLRQPSSCDRTRMVGLSLGLGGDLGRARLPDDLPRPFRRPAPRHHPPQLPVFPLAAQSSRLALHDDRIRKPPRLASRTGYWWTTIAFSTFATFPPTGNASGSPPKISRTAGSDFWTGGGSPRCCCSWWQPVSWRDGPRSSSSSAPGTPPACWDTGSSATSPTPTAIDATGSTAPARKDATPGCSGCSLSERVFTTTTMPSRPPLASELAGGRSTAAGMRFACSLDWVWSGM